MTKIRLAEQPRQEVSDTDVEAALERLADDTRHRTQLPANDMRPTYGGPQRDAINSVIDNIVGDICSDIAKLRTTLDDIEQQVLEGAAGAKARLSEQVAICVSVKDEINHMNRVVADIQERGKAMVA